MTICPVAIVAGCKKCPVVSMCPLKSIIGDYPKSAAAEPEKRGVKKSGKSKK